MSTTPAHTVYAAEAPLEVSLPVSPVVEAPEPMDYSHMPIADVRALVAKYAKPLGVSEHSMFETIRCETPKNADGTWNALGQSLHVKNGVRENSWGLVQIHLTAHTNITKAQAQDPDFAIAWMAEQFEKGNAKWWTCWRELKAKGVI